jgi:hypothetical protein
LNKRSHVTRLIAAPAALGLAALLALPLVALATTSDAIAQTGGMTVTLPGLGTPVTVTVVLDASGNLSSVNLDPTNAATYSASTVNGHAVSFVNAGGTTQVRVKAFGSKLSVGASAATLADLVGSGTWSANVFGAGTGSTVHYTVGSSSGTPTLSIDSVSTSGGATSTTIAPVTKTGKDGSSVSGGATFTKDGFEKTLTIRVSVSSGGAKKASIKITLTGRDVQKMAGPLATLAGSHTWSGTTCAGTAVGLTYTVGLDGSVTYVSATGGTVTLGGWDHGLGFGHGFWKGFGSDKESEHAATATPSDGFLARFDGTRLMVWVRLAQVPNSTDYALLVGYHKGCESKAPVAAPTVNTPVLPGANQPGDHNGDTGKQAGSHDGGGFGGFGGFGSHG